MKTLSKRHIDILQRIGDCWQQGGFPVVRELAQQMGLAGESSLTPTLQRLEKLGYVEIQGGVRGKSRVITLTSLGKAATHSGIPLLGQIPAGPLSEAIEETDTFIEGVGDILPYKAGDFLLRVHGTSMTGDGILPGDLVLLRPGVTLRLGEIAAVQVGDDATLKHVHQQPGEPTVILRASNPDYKDMIVPAEEVSIVGAYRGLVRSGPVL